MKPPEPNILNFKASRHQAATPSSGRILLVDDDRISRRTLQAFLERAGFTVLSAEGVDQAIELLENHPLSEIDCVVTDYRMPIKDGLFMLQWVHQADPQVTSIIVTAEGEKQLVTASLRQGACDFLEKPVDQKTLSQATARAVERTGLNRARARAESDVKAVGKIQQDRVGSAIPECALRVELCYRPSHEAGGDYFNLFPLGRDKFLVLATDVSGHDLRAAYLSAYFQGFVQGLMTVETPIGQILERFNHYLVGDANAIAPDGQITSVAVASVLIDRASGSATSLSCGFPQPHYSDGVGNILPLGELSSSPLGWFDDTVGRPFGFNMTPASMLLLWTDGLEDLSTHLGINPVSCAFTLLRSRRAGCLPTWMKEAKDDILLAGVTDVLNIDNNDVFLPVLFSRNPGSEHTRIDSLQDGWSRSLRMALPEMTDEKHYDLILCLREVFLNALKHGCKGDPAQSATLSVTYNPAMTTVRVIVSDPGPGHDFDWQAHQRLTEASTIDEHRGLMMIHALSKRLETKRRGAHIEMDFSLQPPPAGVAP